jgi:pyroglutamyl-peptidase
MSLSTRTLVTGFGPFLNVTNNPSATLAEQSGRPYRILEVSFEAADAFIQDLDPNSFDRLLMIGVAKGRPAITPERFAKNLIGGTQDVRGRNLAGAIEPDGPTMRSSTLWTPEVLQRLTQESQIQVSEDAGEYLCNYICYQALRRFPQKQVGFLHVPHPHELPLAEQQELLDLILEVLDATALMDGKA